jgi:DNA-binding protein HU-beta
MNKGELIDAISDQTQFSKKDCTTVLDALLAAIQAALEQGDKVTLVGFGTFEVRDRAAREGRNPKTGEPMAIPASRVPAFSAGKQFRQKVSPG